MSYGIVVDSCCDLNSELKEKLGVISVPLSITLGEKYFVDDDNLDLPGFIEEMKNCKGRIGTACPPPSLFGDAFEAHDTSFVVTLSSSLSGSHSSASIAKSIAEEERKADVHIFDSKSASAGEVLIALKLRQLIDKGLQKLEIISAVESFIDNMKTYFVLESVDNLMKNGRLNKVVGRIITALNITPLMGADGNGNIALFSHARGESQIIDKLVETVRKSGKQTEGQDMVISHCNNPSLAEKLKSAVQACYRFEQILITHTCGISSVYASDKGIVVSF